MKTCPNHLDLSLAKVGVLWQSSRFIASKSRKIAKQFGFIAIKNRVKLQNLFINQINEVKQEYKKDSLEYKIPTSFIATVATAETGNMEFEGAPTAKAANNYFGLHFQMGAESSGRQACNIGRLSL